MGRGRDAQDRRRPAWTVTLRARRRRRRAEAAADIDRSSLRDDLGTLVAQMRRGERVHAAEIAAVHPDHVQDAVNLVHYLALRHEDIRKLQRRLAQQGLSSLGRCEPHVIATVESVRAALDGRQRRVATDDALSFRAGRAALDHNTDALLGPRPPGRVPRIMVTLPSEAAHDYALVRRLVSQGMDVARINGAHDGSAEWEQMARHVRKASTELDYPCRVSMDLPGPKVRTGPLTEGPRVLKLRPERDLRGRAVAPAVATLVPTPPAVGDVTALPVDPSWVDRRRVGDVIAVVDTRGSARDLRVIERTPEGCIVEIWDTAYLETGLELSSGTDSTTIGSLAPIAQFHVLHVGDALTLTRDTTPAEPWWHGQPGCARIGCTHAAAFEGARVGQRVLLDDGKLTGVIEAVEPDEIRVRILTAQPGGTKLRAEKGINFPDTDLRVEAVTDADLPLLEVAAAHADMVAMSFLRREGDVDRVREYLRRADAERLGLVLKIETTAGFARLPEILLHAMRSQRVGVMIARGDLAVEAGYERLAEVQEEIMWLCEAAHVPVIWATEVLDRLARTGQPSRAEVTDAAMAQRAECVMLNKGPHVHDAMLVLDDILRRMSAHQRKKTPLLRALRSWADPV